MQRSQTTHRCNTQRHANVTYNAQMHALTTVLAAGCWLYFADRFGVTFPDFYQPTTFTDFLKPTSVFDYQKKTTSCTLFDYQKRTAKNLLRSHGFSHAAATTSGGLSAHFMRDSDQITNPIGPSKYHLATARRKYT